MNVTSPDEPVEVRPGARKDPYHAHSIGVRRFLPRTLFWRSLLIVVMPLFLVQVIGTGIFYDRHVETITRRLALSVAGEIKMLIAARALAPTSFDREAMVDLAERTLELDFEILPGATLRETDRFGSPFSIVDSKLVTALDERITQPFAIDTHSLPQHIVIDVQLSEGVLRTTFNDKRVSSSTTWVFVLWTWGLSAILITISLLFLRNQIRPIRRLAEAAERFGRGGDSGDFKPAGAREVRQAAAAFLEMRARILRHIRQRTDMLAGVSHDLRTPLTRMKLQLALLPRDQAVARLERDIQDMQEMVEGYLDFARGQGDETPSEIDLSDTLRDVIERTRATGFPLEGQIAPGLVATVQAGAFKRAVTNILENAQRYAGTAAVAATGGTAGIEIAIDDDGPGIPPARREEVLRPFRRLEESRNQETGGVGLGLAIAHDFARRHGGELILDESPLGGLRVMIRLPG